MSLGSEIAALRAEIDRRSRRTPGEEQSSSSSPALREQQADSARDRNDVEKLLETMNATLDEFAEELDKFPRLTALAALGVGLALGVVIGRQLR